MIAIVNVGGDPLGVSQYELRINQDVVARFQHNRLDGLARCLREAARVAERAKWEEMRQIIDACS